MVQETLVQEQCKRGTHSGTVGAGDTYSETVGAGGHLFRSSGSRGHLFGGGGRGSHSQHGSMTAFFSLKEVFRKGKGSFVLTKGWEGGMFP